jgi:hypothetical protein
MMTSEAEARAEADRAAGRDWYDEPSLADMYQDCKGPMVPLLMLSYDKSPDFRICDVGELQFYIKQRDLEARDFAAVEAQMQGG